MRQTDTSSPSVLAVRVSHGQHTHPFIPNVLGRIPVAVQNGSATAHPLAVGQREPCVNFTTGGMQTGRGVEAVDDRQMLAIPNGLVLNLPSEFAMCSVHERLGQLGSHQPLQGQVFQTNAGKPTHKIGAQLVKKITPLVANLLVNAGHLHTGLVPPTTSLLAARQLPLSPLQHPLGPAKKPGSRYTLTRGQHRKVLQAQVHANHGIGTSRRKGNVGHSERRREGDVPVSRSVLLECGRLGWQIDRHRLANADPANLGDVDTTVCDLHPLWNAKASLVTLFGLEARKASPPGEKVGKGPVQVSQSLLESLGIDTGQPGRFGLLFECGEFSRERFCWQCLVVLFVVGFAASESPVPHPAAGSRHMEQFRRLLGGRSHAKAKDFGVVAHASIVYTDGVSSFKIGRLISPALKGGALRRLSVIVKKLIRTDNGWSIRSIRFVLSFLFLVVVLCTIFLIFFLFTTMIRVSTTA